MLVLLFFGLWLCIQIHAVQTFAAQKAADYIGKEVNATIELERLEFEFFTTLKLHGLYIEDQNADTLLYIKELAVDLNELDRENRHFSASASLNQWVLNLNRKVGSNDFNHQTIIEYFSSEDSSSAEPWTIDLNHISLAQGAFHFHDFHKSDTSVGVNYKHVDASSINLRANKIEFRADSLRALVDSLSFEEANGFTLLNLSTQFYQDSKTLSFQDLEIKTPLSTVKGNYSMLAPSFSAYSNFIEEVELHSELKSTSVNIADIAYFAPALNGLKEQLKVEAKVDGTINNLSGEDVKLNFNEQTYLLGDIEMRGLPNIEETFIYFDLKEFATTAYGLSTLPFPNNPDRKLSIPENLKSLGIITFEGNFVGYYNDFVAYGELGTQLGKVETDLKLLESDNGELVYTGNVKTAAFDFGTLLQINQLADAGLDLEIDGKGLQKDRIKAEAKGSIQALTFADYTYQDINLDGFFQEGEFMGDLSMDDPNLKFQFTGDIKTAEDYNSSDFKLAVDYLKPVKLGLVRRTDSSMQLSFKADIDFDFKSLDQFDGRTLIQDLAYRDAQNELNNQIIDLTSTNQNNQREIILQSSMLDAELRGFFSFKELPNSLNRFINYYLKEGEELANSNQYLELSADFKNCVTTAKVLIPGLMIDTNTQLNFIYDEAKHSSSLVLESNRIGFKGQDFTDLSLNILADEKHIEQKLRANSYQIAKLNRLDSLTLESSFINAQLNSTLLWHSPTELLREGELNSLIQFNSLNDFNLQLLNSYLKLDEQKWSINEGNQFEFNDSLISISDFEIKNAQQQLGVNGLLSKREEDTLTILIQNIALDKIADLSDQENTKMKGIANGVIEISEALQDASLLANLFIDDLIFNEVRIGDSRFESEWDQETKALELDGQLGVEENKLLDFFGRYYPKRKEQSLALTLNFSTFPLLVLEPYLEEYLTEIKGDLSGRIRLNGNPTEPLLKGRLQMNETGMRVNYLNASYQINDELIIEPDFIGFDLIEIKDENGEKAIATGTIFHNNYKDLNLDVGLEYSKFLALSTTAKDNELFYGTAIATGTANISGFADQLIININASALRGTDFNIPLSDGVTVSETDFLTFTNSPKVEETKSEVDLSGIQLNFDLDIKPEAKVKIIFDEQIGDVLEANGFGNLKLEINTLGDFNIYGQYEIEKGDYLFTLKNVLSKKFQLAKGSRISWDGDPYRAKIDMQAIYNTRASLAVLMPDDSTTNLNRRSPVELELQMSSYLLSPEIAFDIRLPNTNEQIRQRLQSILYINQNQVNEQEMNQQVFGLLFLNRFLPPASGTAQTATGASGRGAPGLNNGYEMLSNQMSNWLSKISDQFDVGVNYRQGNEFTGDEFDLSLSTELFSNRLILDGNFGYTNNNQIQADQDQSNFVGEFSVEYKLSRDGRLRVSGFNRSVNNNLLQTVSPYTQGVGLFYREEFDTFNQLWRRYFSRDSKSKKKNP